MSATHILTDYFQLGLIGYCVIGAEGIEYGFGVHQWDVPLEKIDRFRKVGFVLFKTDEEERLSTHTVGQRVGNILLPSDIYDKALNILAISPNIRAHPSRHPLARHQRSHLDQLTHLRCGHVSIHLPMYATR